MTNNSSEREARDERVKKFVAELRIKNADAIERRRLSGFGLPDSEKTPEQKAYSVYKIHHDIEAMKKKDRKASFVLYSLLVVAIIIFIYLLIFLYNKGAAMAPSTNPPRSGFCQTEARTFAERRLINEVCQ